MVVLDTSYRQLVKLLGKKVSVKELEDSLFDMGLELKAEGDDLHIEITPDRPDLISAYGIARALRAYLKIKPGMPTYKVKKSSMQVFVKPSVKDVRPCTVAAIVKNLKFNGDKIKDMIFVQEKLHATFGRNRKKIAIGIYPLDKIVPPVTYSAEDPDSVKFVPLDSVEAMTGRQVLSRHPTGKQYAKLLENYGKFPFFIDSAKQVMSMPPIINSESLGRVDFSTNDIFIECSGHDMRSLGAVLNMLVAMFADMGGEIFSVEVNYGNKKVVTPDLEPEKRQIKASYVNSILGTNLSAAQLKPLLGMMMYDVTGIAGDVARFSVPAFRSDIMHDVDVADDVGRAYGFGNLVSEHKQTATVADTTGDVKISSKVAGLMVGLGYQQAFTLALTSSDDQFVKMNMEEIPHVKLGSVADKSLDMVRVWMIPELLKCLVNNRSREYPQRFFETSYIVKPDESADVKFRNVIRFAAVTAHKSANYTEAKQAMEYLLDSLGFAYSIENAEHSSFIPGRVGRVIVNGKKVGFIGEIHPKVLCNLGLEVPVSAVELNFTDILEG